MDTDASRVLKPVEAARILGIGHNRVRELIRAGSLRALPGRRMLVPDVALEEYLATAKRGQG